MNKISRRVLLGIIISLLCFISINDTVYAGFSNNKVQSVASNSNGNSSNMCSSNQIAEFRSEIIEAEINKLIDIVNNLYLPEILQYTNAMAEEYRNLINNYNNLFSDLIDASMNNIASARIKYPCDFGSEYEILLNFFREKLQEANNSLNDAIMAKLSEAEATAKNNGENTREYLDVKLVLKIRKDNNKTKIDEEITKDIEDYKTNLDKINNDNKPIEDDKENDIKDEIGECQGILTPEMLELINEAIKWIRISVPILLIVLGSIDFGKAVLADDKDIMKKSSTAFVKRCVIAIAIFFLPTLINILIAIFNSVSDKPLADLINCGIK